MSATQLRALLICLGLAILLPLLGSWLRRQEGQGCALDGQAINPAYRVRIVDQGGESRVFCCIRCGELWLARAAEKKPREIWVTDETSGREIRAAEAFFVRSRIFTNQPAQDRVHAFHRIEDAESHAESFAGTVLSGEKRPFAGQL